MCRAGSGQEFSPGASERQLPGGFHLFPQTSLIEGLDQGQRAAAAWPRSVLIAW